MSEYDLGRVEEDLGIMRQAIGLHLSFGSGMLTFGGLLAAMAIASAVLSVAAVELRVDQPWLQLIPVTAILIMVPVALFVKSRRAPGVDEEIIRQVVVSISIYAVVWVAACGYGIAAVMAPSIGRARMAGLYASSMILLVGFSVMLVRAALKRRDRHYCLGLAVSTFLAGMLLPLLNGAYTYAFAHGIMALGLCAAAAIQFVQLRETVTPHAAD